MELIAKLGVDWQLLLAQIVNFTILLAILAIFVYKPLLKLLDERREKIRRSLEDVKKIERERQELEQWRHEQMCKIDQEVGAFFERAKTDAEKTREEILASAKKEAQEMLRKGREEMAQERAQVAAEVQASLASVILRLSEKILEREFNPVDQKRLLEGLERDIPTMLR